MVIKQIGVDELSALQQEKNEIERLQNKDLSVGDSWYLVERHWFEQCKKFYDEPLVVNNPGPIDNTSLLDFEPNNGSCSLKENLMETAHYIFVPEEAWQKLKSRFDLLGPQHEICRNVIESGTDMKTFKIEVYCLHINVDVRSKNGTHSFEFVSSRQRTLASIYQHIMEQLNTLGFSKAQQNLKSRLLIRYIDGSVEQIQFDSETTLEDINFYTGQRLLVDLRNEDGTWNVDLSKQQPSFSRSSVVNSRPALAVETSHLPSNNGGGGITPATNNNINISSSASSSNLTKAIGGLFSVSSGVAANLGSSASSENFNKKLPPPGLCGLTNLGNTCFMNSALQCISNTPPLCEYFITGQYESEINESNPLGMRGEMARAFGDLMKQIWSSKNHQCVNPRNFKSVVGRFAPQFSGYQQQDSQELLAFLLDGLHEDLNRVRKKPYIEAKDYDGMQDAAAASEAWKNYKLRNDSVIVDLFHGQLKSTLVCPECSKRSVTFDPFCYLSLPLTVKQERQILVTFVPFDVREPLKQCQVSVSKNGTFKDLAELLGNLLNRNPQQIILARTYNNKILNTYPMNEDLTSLVEREGLVAYETPLFSPDDVPITLVVYNRISRKPTCGYSNLVGLPLILLLKREELSCYDSLKSILQTTMSRFVHFEDEDLNENNMQDDNENDSGVDDENGDSNQDDHLLQRRVLHAAKTSSASSSSNAMECSPPGRPSRAAAATAGGEASAAAAGGGNTSAAAAADDFRIILTNSYGSSDVQSLNASFVSSQAVDNLALSPHNCVYVCLEWKEKFQKYFEDDLPVEKHPSVHLSNRLLRRSIQLTDCLELFTMTERLGKHDLWYCPQCKKHQQATKKFDLWNLPEILIIHLKRFSYDSYYRSKIETLVEFPLEKLNISQFVMNDSNVQDCSYDLIAVSNHYGGLAGGHYTAYAKNKVDNQWYLFDDSRVSKASESEVVSKSAYVLVYARRPGDQSLKLGDSNFDIEDCDSDE